MNIDRFYRKFTALLKRRRMRRAFSEAVSSGDVQQVIEIVDPIVKRAVRKASDRAHAAGLEVSDGRVAEERRQNRLEQK